MVNDQENSTDTILSTLKRAIEDGQEKNVRESLETLNQLDLKSGSQSLKSDSGYELLRLSIQKKYNSISKLLLQHGVEVNRQNTKKRSNTPLHLAVRNDDLEMIKLLLKNGADTKCTSSTGKSPLYLAVELNYVDIAELLLEKDPDVNINCDNNTVPIHAAAYTGNEYLFNLLLSYGGRPKLKNFDNESASMLQVAVEECYVKTVEKLVNSSKVSEFINEPGNEKLITVAAVKWGDSYRKIVQVLLKAKFPIDPKNAKNSEFICTALRKKYYSIVSELLKVGLDLDNYENILKDSCEYNNVEAAEAVIHKVGDFTLKGYNGKKLNLLFYVIDNLHSIIEDANSKDSAPSNIDTFNRWFEIMKLLVVKGFDVNGRDSNNLTVLHYISHQTPSSISLSLKPIVNFLITAGASTTQTSESLLTPLDYAISKENIDVVEVLLQYASDIDSNVRKTSHIHYAAENESPAITKLLLKHKANINLIDNSGNMPIHIAAAEGKINVIKYLLKHKAIVNAKNFAGQTPLHLVCKRRHYVNDIEEKCIEILIKYKANVDAKDKDLMTPLHYAAKWSCNPLTIKKLLEYNANLHSVNKFGLTPLLVAASFNEHSIVSFLVGCGAKINDVNKHGETALHLLAQRCVYPMKNILKENFDINTLSHEKKTALDYLIESGQDGNRFYTDYLENVHAFIKYMLKLHNIGVYVCKENLEGIEKYVQDFVLSYRSADNIVEFKEKCEKEAVLLKENKIGDTNMTYYKLFKKSTHQLAQYLLAKNVLKEMKPSKYAKMFPIYCELITQNLERGFERKKILDQDGGGLVKKMLYNLPGSCVDEILSYLNNKDLQALITANEIRKESTKIFEPRITRSRTAKKLKLDK